MSCSGCSNALTRILSKSDSIDSFTVSLADQRVQVKTERSKDDIHGLIAKSGKKTLFLETVE